MAVNNSELYLRKAIDSVVNQSLNFEDTIQLILVNDGSIDQSEKICLEYQEQYPDNIIVLSQEHKGVSSARNLGLKHVMGEYVNFLDSDDYISQNTLEDVYDFFKFQKNFIDVVSIPIYNFERNNLEDELNDKFSSNKIIYLDSQPDFIQNSVSSTFIKSDIAKKYTFNENLNSFEDTLYINNILLNKKKYGVINSAKYYFRQRNSQNSLHETIIFENGFQNTILECFFLNLFNSSLNQENEIPIFIKHILSFNLRKFIKLRDKLIFDSKMQGELMINIFKKILSYIDDDILELYDIEKFFSKNLFKLIKYNDFHIDDDKNNYIVSRNEENFFENNLILNNFEIDGDVLSISANSIIPYLKDNITLEVIKKGENGTVLKKFYKIDDIETNKQDTFLSFLNYNFKIKIPLESNKSFELEFLFKCLENSYLNDVPNIFLKNFDEESLKEYSLEIKDNTLKFTKKFLFSVVMPIYNVEKYLSEAIDSLINQTIGFEENIELIIIDDESPDRSKDIALEYQEKYPNNINIFSKLNGGQASAFNLGLKYIHGKYINFLDSDDYLSENTFEEVYKFFEKHYNEIDLVALPLILFERKNGPHNLNYKFKETRVIDLVKEPNNPQLSISSSVVKRECFKNLEFDTTLTHAYDALVVNKILLNKKKYGVINTCNYYYRQRYNTTSMIDNLSTKKESFTHMLKYFFAYLIDYCKEKEGDVPVFIQYLLAYDFQWILRQPSLDILETDLKKDEFWHYFNYVIKNIGEKAVIKNHQVDKRLYAFFMFLRNQEYELKEENDDIIMLTKNYIIDKFKNHWLWLDIVEIRDGYLRISGLFSSYFNTDSYNIYLVKEDENGSKEKFKSDLKFYTHNSRKNSIFLDIPWNYKFNFDVEAPVSNINNSKFYFELEFDEGSHYLTYNPKIQFSFLCNFSDSSAYLVKDSKILLFKHNNFILMPYKYHNMLRFEYSNLKKIYNDKSNGYQHALLIRVIYLILYPIMKNRKIWLFSDRPIFADDNATHLFKYSIKQNDGIKKYFVIKKESEDYANMKKVSNNVLNFGSLKHEIMYMFAEKYITSFTNEIYMNPFYEKNYNLYSSLAQFKRYFLQHGIAVGNFSSMLNKFSNKLSFLNTASELEKESYLGEGYNFDKGVVQVLGPPRYDNLYDDSKSKKQIVFMPSWRIGIHDEDSFVNSKYYEKIHSFLNNPDLNDFLNEKGYKLVFRPHPEVFKFIDSLKINSNIRLSFDVSKESYQDLFRDSSILITDYSSVFFDFAFLKKPVIYYQYADEYNYQKGYFDFDTMGFGEVFDEEDDLISKIKDYINNGCIMEEEYKNRVNKFFKFTDKNNCKRVYEWILNH